MRLDRLIQRPLDAAPARPARGLRTLQVETIVPVPVDTAFTFFSDAANLEQLTPPWVNFRIKTPMPVRMFAGAMIDYQIALYGVPLPWRTRIDVWEPGRRFVDRQVSGPYIWWRHEHRFERAGTGTLVIDEVEYLPRLPWLTSWLVERDVRRIFDFRRQALTALLTDDLRDAAPASVALTQ